MIALDFFWAVGIFTLLVTLALIAGSFEFRHKTEKESLLDPKFICVCSVCTYNFVKTREESISVCPRCGSFNKK